MNVVLWIFSFPIKLTLRPFCLRFCCVPVLMLSFRRSQRRLLYFLPVLREEQVRARITMKQASPFFFDKLLQLCTFLRSHIFADDVSPLQRYLFARDLAFFCLQSSRVIGLRILDACSPKRF